MKDKYRVESKRLYLREVKPEDANVTYCRWLNDPDVNRFLETRHSPQTIATIRAYIEKTRNDPDEVFLAICLKDGDKHIGNIKIGPINRIHHFADMSLFIGEKRLHGKGIATEAIAAFSDFAFNVLKLNKIKAGFYAENIASMKAFGKAGFKEEGRLTKQLLMDGKYTDWVIMARNRG